MTTKFEFSDKRRKLTVYNLNAVTNEYIGCGEACIEPHVGLPQFSTIVEPPESKDGFVRVWNENEYQWDYVISHRGKTAYRKDSREEFVIEMIGELSELCTFIAPSSQYDKWQDGVGWVKDEAAELADLVKNAEAKKTQLLSSVAMKIGVLQDAVELDMATEEETSQLKELKTYRVLLNRVNTSELPIIWPTEVF